MSKWKWYRDGTEMVQKWYRDGTEMVQRRYRDGTEMVQTQVKLKGLEPGQFQAGWNSIITVLIPYYNFGVAEEQ